MAFENLAYRVDRAGFGQALVHLNKARLVVREASEEPGSEGYLRPPAYQREAIRELRGIFTRGWDELRASQDSLDRAELTSDVRGLLRRTRPQDYRTSHMVLLPHLGIAYGAVTREGLESLQGLGDNINAIHLLPDDLELIQPQGQTAQPLAAQQNVDWGLVTMCIPQLWAMGYKGKNVKIAHLDTGIDSLHPAMTGTVGQAMFFKKSSGAKQSITGPFKDTDGHGTNTGGILVAAQNGMPQTVSVAPEATLISGIVIEGGKVSKRVVNGLEWVKGKGARVLSLSVGFSKYTDDFVDLFQELRNLGILPVVGIGNTGGQTCSPGNYPTALSVGATNYSNMVAWESGYALPGQKGIGPLCCAPGANVRTAKDGGGYELQTGSSMAAPHVAGLAALLFQARPSATIDQVQQAILLSCKNPKNEPAMKIGAGIPCAPDALAELIKMVP